MTNWKKFALVLMAALTATSLACCGEKETDGSSTAETTAASAAEDETTAENQTEAETEAETHPPIPQEYDGTEIDDQCAQVISDYFTAIMNQDYDAYKAALDPYYLEVYNSWLNTSFGYGMETSFETMHQNLMDSASKTNEDGTVTSPESVQITKITLTPTKADDGEDAAVVIKDYLAQYDSVIGEGFSDELCKQCDDVVNVTFTMTADCDGEVRDIMTDMELLMTVADGTYRILG